MRRAKKNWSKQNIPLKLWVEVLYYLPVKSLLRFRSVSKSWKSIIEDPNFSSKHLKRSLNNTQKPYFIFSEFDPEDQEQWVLRRSINFRKASDIVFPLSSRDIDWEFCNGVDGLILLFGSGYSLKSEDNIVLWNPSIRKVIYLPPPPALGIDIEVLLCILFDAASDDYKVVMIPYDINKEESVSTHIYSLKSHSWRRAVDSNKGRMCLDRDSNACIGGSAHWIGEHNSYQKVVSFDLASDRFWYTQCPEEANNMDTPNKKLIVLSGTSLGFMALFPDYHVTVWAKGKSLPSTFDKSEIQQCCWTKSYEIYANLPSKIFFVSVEERDVLLCRSRRFKFLVSHDLETEDLKVRLTNYLWYPSYIYPYVESLLLLEHTLGPNHRSQSSQSSGDD